MADRSNIEWTDSTFNPWLGCTKVSPACDHCYAEAMMDTRLGRVRWGAGQPRSRTSPANWRKPMQWNASDFSVCDECGHAGRPVRTRGIYAYCEACSAVVRARRRRVFCASLADVFDNAVPVVWLVDLLDLIRGTPNLDWLLLTKRIGRVNDALEDAMMVVKDQQRNHPLYIWLIDWITGKPPANVWIGATICNQAEAERDIPKLLAAPAAVRFLSIEPMLGPVYLFDASQIECDHEGGGQCPDTGAWECRACENRTAFEHFEDRLHWVIAGGESGSSARPSHPDWFRILRDDCAAAGVPFLFKQWGEWGNADCDDERTPIHGSAGLLPSGDALFDYSPPFDDSEALRARGGVRLDGRTLMLKVGKKRAGRLLDGVTHDGFPQP